MVARYATFLCANQRLVKREKHLVQLVDIVVFVYKKILHDNIKFAAMRERKTRSADEIPRFVNIQFQSKSKRKRRCL